MGASIRRREFLSLGVAGAGLAAAQDNPSEESVTASATEDATPIVSVIPSSFDGAEDHDGTVIQGLGDPRPTSADLTDEQLDAMVRTAIKIASPVSSGLNTIITDKDWVVIKTRTAGCPGEAGYLAGSSTDPRVVRSLLTYLTSNGFGRRFSIVDGSIGCSVYQDMIADFRKRHPKLRFELLDLDTAETSPVPVPEGASAANNPDGIYHVPNTILGCDKLISVAPMMTDARFGVALTVGNYLGIAPASKYGPGKEKLFALGDPAEVLLDLYAYHPADFAIAGGQWGIQGDGQPIHHNLIVAGANAVAVDAIAATIMGFDGGDLPYLDMAELNGHGIWDPYSIWVRGQAVEDATHPFTKPSGWE